MTITSVLKILYHKVNYCRFRQTCLSLFSLFKSQLVRVYVICVKQTIHSSRLNVNMLNSNCKIFIESSYFYSLEHKFSFSAFTFTIRQWKLYKREIRHSFIENYQQRYQQVCVTNTNMCLLHRRILCQVGYIFMLLFETSEHRFIIQNLPKVILYSDMSRLLVRSNVKLQFY